MKALQWCVILASLAIASVVPVEQDAPTRVEERDSACTNGPLTRACWANGFSIATDFDQKHPTTGNTVSYTLEITNGTCAPDGNARLCFLVNGQYPGPTIVADWGDMVEVTVINKLQDNGTTIHFHGVRQLNTCGADGVPGLTECPIAPGSSSIYRFQATQYGTSWYHSHFSSQYGDGVIGTIIFNGPASSNYDIDLGVFPVNDWYYQTAFQINSLTSFRLQNQLPPPNADNLLINGSNKDATGKGQYSQVTMTKGKKYRLRLVNISVDNFIRVSLDNHTMTVMTSDFIPVKPFSTSWILIGIGQRYDVVINANQAADNYWFRAETATDCLSGNNFHGRAIFSYEGVNVADPTTNATSFVAGCIEPTPAPYWVQAVPNASFTSTVNEMNLGVTRAQVIPGGDVLVVWALTGSSMNIAWDDPTLQYVMEGNTTYAPALNVLPTVSEGNWNFWVVQQVQPLPFIPHPIHLHGHDFFVLGQGTGTFNASTATLNFATAPRRDTATVYGSGWLAIAFNSNNPGAWLMHCHIAWHISEGLGVQFLEAPSSIVLPDSGTFESQCNAWKAYSSTAYYPKDDSGL